MTGNRSSQRCIHLVDRPGGLIRASTARAATYREAEAIHGSPTRSTWRIESNMPCATDDPEPRLVRIPYRRVCANAARRPAAKACVRAEVSSEGVRHVDDERGVVGETTSSYSRCAVDIRWILDPARVECDG